MNRFDTQCYGTNSEPFCASSHSESVLFLLCKTQYLTPNSMRALSDFRVAMIDVTVS